MIGYLEVTMKNIVLVEIIHSHGNFRHEAVEVAFS